MVLYKAAVELDVEQRLALVCRLVLVACGARGLAVACHQVPYLHPGYVGVVFCVAIITQCSSRGGGDGAQAEDFGGEGA